jgi:nicotinamide riboside kinase
MIVVTGPESTGKSVLSEQLARYYGAVWEPEYARQYLTGKSSYCYEDVEHIARAQIARYHELSRRQGLVFLDTWLIITRVWFLWSYKYVPEWLDTALGACNIDLYLLCRPDIPWVPDPLRENGGDSRKELFDIYRNELVARQLPFVEVAGQGDARFQLAVSEIQRRFGTMTSN